jgi:hypothetical protein
VEAVALEPAVPLVGVAPPAEVNLLDAPPPADVTPPVIVVPPAAIAPPLLVAPPCPEDPPVPTGAGVSSEQLLANATNRTQNRDRPVAGTRRYFMIESLCG